MGGQARPAQEPRDASALGIETVHQDLALCDNLDIVQNMFLGREKVRRLALAEEDMEKAAGATLSSLAVTTVRSIRQPVASLSGGQRQSVAIAKAVLWNSKLVIMDEPTAALGVAQTAMVLDLVRRLADRGLAVMIVSHNMNDVFEVADRIAVLCLGKMVAVRPAAELDRQIVVDLMTSGVSTRTATAARERGWPMTKSEGPESEGAVQVAAGGGAVRGGRDPGRAGDRPRDPGQLAGRIPAGRAGPGEGGRERRAAGGGGLMLISVLFQSLNSNFLSRATWSTS